MLVVYRHKCKPMQVNIFLLLMKIVLHLCNVFIVSNNLTRLGLHFKGSTAYYLLIQIPRTLRKMPCHVELNRSQISEELPERDDRAWNGQTHNKCLLEL